MTSPREPTPDEYDAPPFTQAQLDALRIATTAGPYYALGLRAVVALESLARDFAFHVRQGSR